MSRFLRLLKSFSQNIGCEYLDKVGTGKCTDVANNARCGFDGGDCCGVNINTDFCTECICYEELNCAAPLDLIGNGFCNDESNNEDCNYDGGDCCGSCANTEYCSDCLCHAGSPMNMDCKYIITNYFKLI